MKSADKKTPEKKATPPAPETEHQAQEAGETQQAPRLKLDLNSFAWFRIFRFANLLCKQG
jgi:hypothetical protein